MSRLRSSQALAAKSARRPALLAGFTAALLLTSSMTPVSRAVAQQLNQAEQAESDAADGYTNSNYQPCTLDVLSKFWRVEDTYQVKVRIGRAILAHKEAVIDADLNTAGVRGITRNRAPFGNERLIEA